MTRTAPGAGGTPGAESMEPLLGAEQVAPAIWSPLLALDRRLFGAQAKHTMVELAEQSAVEMAVAGRLWRAMGFSAVPDHEPVFVDDDLAALRLAAKALADSADPGEIVYQTRVMAGSLSRVAEVVSDAIVRDVDEMVRSGLSGEEIAERMSAGPDAGEIDRLVGYVYRRQLRAALWRKLADPRHIGIRGSLTVGFVDLVRFTAVTEDIAEEQLGDLVDRFESVVYDRVAESGGRVVKMIGDEVMFVAEDVEPATRIAVELVSAFEADPSVPTARAGLALGPVLAHGGDYFGPVVNLAARIVDIARPSTVVVSDEVYAVLAERAGLSWRKLPHKHLKGIGRVDLYAVSAGDENLGARGVSGPPA